MAKGPSASSALRPSSIIPKYDVRKSFGCLEPHRHVLSNLDNICWIPSPVLFGRHLWIFRKGEWERLSAEEVLWSRWGGKFLLISRKAAKTVERTANFLLQRAITFFF